MIIGLKQSAPAKLYSSKLRGRLRIVVLFLVSAVSLLAAVIAANRPADTNASAESLSVTSISPATGPTTGFTWLTIKGTGFPDKVKISDYEQIGLVAQWDGIDNTGQGDDKHDDSTTVWKDLIGQNDVTLNKALSSITSGGGWKDRGFKQTDNAFFQKDNFVGSATGEAGKIPIGNAARTIEVVYTTPYDGESWNSGYQWVFAYGTPSQNLRSWYVGQGLGHIFPVANYGNNCQIPFASVPGAQDRGKVQALQGTWDGTSLPDGRDGFVDGVDYSSYCHSGSDDLDFGNDRLVLGSYIDGAAGYIANNFTLNSFRIYNRALTQSELAANFQVDQNRFIAPPEVKIGGVTCTNLVVISATEMKCKTPAKPLGSYDVELTFDNQTITSPQQFTYQNFTLSSVSPNRGPETGGNVVSIFGANFPYVETGDYIQEGLVAQYDAINNTGQGDKFHSGSATVWKDLTGNGNDCVFENANFAWAENKIIPNGVGWTANCGATPSTAFAGEVTMEATLISKGAGLNEHMIAKNYTNSYYLLRGYSSGQSTTVVWINNQSYAAGTIFGNNTLVTLQGSFKNNGYAKIYHSGTLQSNTSVGTQTLPINTGDLYLGRAQINSLPIVNSDIFALRLYNRQLDDSEIQLNASLDQLRFLSPPTVTIGGQSCTNVAVISAAEIRCTAPAGTLGAANVTVTDSAGVYSDTLIDGYTYVDDFYVSAQSTNHGAAGDIITFAGKALNQVTAVTIDGNTCVATDPVIDISPTSYSCKIPAETDYTNNTKDIVFATDAYGAITLQQAWTYDTFMILDAVGAAAISLSLNPASQPEATADVTFSAQTNHARGYGVSVATHNSGVIYVDHPNDLYCSATAGYLPALTSGGANLATNSWAYKLSTASNWLAPSTLPQLLKSTDTHSVYGVPDQFALRFGAKINFLQPACTYTGAVLVTLLPNP
jgi:hypothetical protein